MAKEQKLGPGQRFGKWTLEGDEPLGSGGNGAVWLVGDESGIRAAMKFLHRHHYNTKRHARFKDEIQFMRRHASRAGILPLLDSNSPDSPTPDDRPWLVTPFAVPLNTLGLSGAAKLDDLVRRMEGIARTLAELHAQKVWHRDLKPDNLFDFNGTAVVGDFGLVEFPDKGPVTEPTEIMGPAFYIAPEMMRDAGDVPAGPADVYSFAKTLWVLASGQKYPLQGEQRAEIPQLRLSTNCPHPRATILDGLLDRATRYDPSQRPPMAEVARELQAWQSHPQPATTSTLNVVALAREFRAVFDAGNKAQQRRADFLRNAKGIISQFEGVLVQIGTDTNMATALRLRLTEGSLPPRFHASQTRAHGLVLERWVKMVETSLGHLYRVTLQSFVQVEAMSTGKVRVIVGHLVRYDVGTEYGAHWQFPWADEVEAHPDSAEFEKESQRQHREFRDNLGKGIQAFAEQVKTIPSEA